MIAELKPHVLTLEGEMPGKSGLEFLEELMESKPMPGVMLSTLTQKGAPTSFKALELGAIECFPKPQPATPAEFDKTVDKRGKQPGHSRVGKDSVSIYRNRGAS